MSENITAWQKYKNSLGETRPWDMLNPVKYVKDSDVSDKRLEICKTCPELIKLTTQCKKCGCFMAAKTKLEEAVCPLGKW
jgi:hypothetical protein